jgi:RNA polymerase primary sigma factor
VLKKLIALGRTRGYITYEELNTYLPGDEFSPEMIEATIGALTRADINVVEEGEVLDQPEGRPEAEAEPEAEKEVAEPGGRSDDPVRMYLREMGNVELLSRDGEIEIAKRIEAGREMIISSLCESPMVMQEILSWRDDLATGALLLRDVIDLDAAYGADAEGKPVFAAADVPVENVAEKVMEKKDDTALLLAKAKEEERKRREKEKAERERLAREKAEKEKAAKEKAAKDKAAKATLRSRWSRWKTRSSPRYSKRSISSPRPPRSCALCRKNICRPLSAKATMPSPITRNTKSCCRSWSS